MPWKDSLLIQTVKHLFCTGQHISLLSRFLLILAGVTLSACSALSPSTTQPNVDWRTHQQNILRLSDWQLSGRLNIRQAENSETVNINWRQSSTAFEINLSGSLGLGAVRINGNAAGVTIEKAGEEPIIANSLSELSEELLGFHFPEDSLQYWVRGIPAPGLASNNQYNDNNLLTSMAQSDSGNQSWQLSYDRYEVVNAIWLPGRIRLEDTNYRLTFLVSDWQVPQE